jgi:hypothetical protein
MPTLVDNLTSKLGRAPTETELEAERERKRKRREEKAAAASSQDVAAKAKAEPPPSPKRQAVEVVLGLSAAEIVERVPAAELSAAATALDAAAKAVRAQVDDAARAGQTAARLDEMVAEAQAWLPSPVPDVVLRQLLQGMRLYEMATETLDDDFEESTTYEKLTLKFHMPWRYTGNLPGWGLRQQSSIDLHEWEVHWYDYYRRSQVSGRITCPPFLEDPPYNNRLGRIDGKAPDVKERCEKLEDQLNELIHTIRPDWKLSFVHGLRELCEGWRRAAGLKAKQLAWEDAARAVCAGAGMLARDAESNCGGFVLQRLMCVLEKEMRAFKNPSFDKSVLSESEKVRRHGGLLTSPAMLECLRHEARWERNTKHPRATGGAAASSSGAPEDELR